MLTNIEEERAKRDLNYLLYVKNSGTLQQSFKKSERRERERDSRKKDEKKWGVSEFSSE